MKAIEITGKILRVFLFAGMAAGFVASLQSCSTTRRLPEGEILYTGVKKVDIQSDSASGVPSAMASAIRTSVDVAPNNYFKLLKWRYPFPLGLWVYNNWPNPEKGFKHWIYEKLVEEPVLLSDVRPEVRTHMIEEILDNNGYFRGTATYSLVQGKNKRKAKILYDVKTGPAYPVDSIEFLPDTCRLYHLIDSLAARDRYLSAVRPRFSTDSLSVARMRITNGLRNRGYYFFKPTYIEYLADSIARPGSVLLRMTLAANTPRVALQPYVTGDVTVRVNRNRGGGMPDTVQLRRATLIQMMPSRLRRKLFDENIAFRPGRTFSVRNMDRTQSNLSRLGIFNSINIEAWPDTLTSGADGRRRLNVDIDCTFDAPLEASVEVNASSKSNSYIGPGITLGITNKNIFGGGEQLSVKATGSYEWQTGSGRKSIFNS